MSGDQSTEILRRTVLQGAAGAAAVAPVFSMPTGQGANDFAFLSGEWAIKHRRLKAAGEWDAFEGEASVWPALGGMASIEELRIPAWDFSGMGLRFFDPEKGDWADHWVNGKARVVNSAMYGRFEDGVGNFELEEMDGDRPIKVRGVWDRITATSCRWWQSVSRDGGATWEVNWYMDWTRR